MYINSFTILVLGKENKILPEKSWPQYFAEIFDDKIVCTSKKRSKFSY